LNKGQSYPERRWSQTPEFMGVLRGWKAAGSTVLLGLVWQAYDRLRIRAFAGLRPAVEDKDLERSITQLLEPEIHQVMTGYEPFYVQHGLYEHETRALPPAQPPEYDIAFVLWSNPRVMWPLEAKVLRTDGTVAAYIAEIRNDFLTCRYSPFSSEAAMLGYLLSGEPKNTFADIAQKGNWQLSQHPDFADRDHKISDHTRDVPMGKPYPVQFRCHHLIFRLQI